MDVTSINRIGERAGQSATVRGWLYNRRSSGKIQFLIVRDGTGYLQAVVVKSEVDPAVWDTAEQATQECSLSVTGSIREEKRAPGEGETVASGAWAFGWALDDSGIAQVLLSADGGPAQPILSGQPHPGVVEVYPNYPGVDKPGFGFGIPALPPGPHSLTLTLIARDGGKTEVQRRIVIR